jgi:F1F0 ATPase subunit 2
MNPLLAYSASFITGILLGLFFLQGLWLTVRSLEGAPHPAMRMILSLLLRFAVVLAGFGMLAVYAGWQHVLTAVLGFTLLRVYFMRRFMRRQRERKEAE